MRLVEKEQVPFLPISCARPSRPALSRRLHYYRDNYLANTGNGNGNGKLNFIPLMRIVTYPKDAGTKVKMRV